MRICDEVLLEGWLCMQQKGWDLINPRVQGGEVNFHLYPTEEKAMVAYCPIESDKLTDVERYYLASKRGFIAKQVRVSII